MFISEKKLKALITAEVTKSTRELALRVQAALDMHSKELEVHKQSTETYQETHLAFVRRVLENECIQAEALTDIAALLRELLHRSLPKAKAKKLKANA